MAVHGRQQFVVQVELSESVFAHILGAQTRRGSRMEFAPGVKAQDDLLSMVRTQALGLRRKAISQHNRAIKTNANKTSFFWWHP